MAPGRTPSHTACPWGHVRRSGWVLPCPPTVAGTAPDWPRGGVTGFPYTCRRGKAYWRNGWLRRRRGPFPPSGGQAWPLSPQGNAARVWRRDPGGGAAICLRPQDHAAPGLCGAVRLAGAPVYASGVKREAGDAVNPRPVRRCPRNGKRREMDPQATVGCCHPAHLTGRRIHWTRDSPRVRPRARRPACSLWYACRGVRLVGYRGLSIRM